MSAIPQPYYRSAAAKALAEKVANSDPYATLDVKINIDQVLTNRDQEYIEQVNQAIADNIPFILFADKGNYIIIIPSKFTVACFADDVQQTMEVLKDMQQFQNRIKIAFTVYDKFIRADRLIEGGGNGNESISFTGERKDLPDGEEGQGCSETVVPE